MTASTHVLRLTLAAWSMCLAVAAAPATQSSRATRITSPIKHAGIYHIVTGTWTRASGQTAAIGPDTIYNNFATAGYLSALAGSGPGSVNKAVLFDEGSVPTSGNTNHPGANRDSYNVNCVDIAYCDFGPPASSAWSLGFYDSYSPCTFSAAITASVAVAGLPAQGCWAVSLDLTGGREFVLQGDGGDGFDDDPSQDSFGWTHRYAGTAGAHVAGFIYAGDPASTDPSWFPGTLPTDGRETYYGPLSPCGTNATGLLTADEFWALLPAGGSGCVSGSYSNPTGCGAAFNPYHSFAIKIAAGPDTCAPVDAFTYCLSNPNSTGLNSILTFDGCLSSALDNVTMTAQVPADVIGFFVTSQTSGFVPNPGGSAGNLCLGGSIGRFVGPGQIKNSGPGGSVALSTSLGEWSLSAIPASSSSYAAAAGLTSRFQYWHRDIVGTITSNFSNGYAITWLP